MDKTGSNLQIVLDQTTLWPANNKPVSVTATVYSSDHLSEVDSVVLTSITPSETIDLAGPMVSGAEYETLDTTFDLLATKASGKADLVYTITYTAQDKADNKTVVIVTVRVPHDQSDHSINQLSAVWDAEWVRALERENQQNRSRF